MCYLTDSHSVAIPVIRLNVTISHVWEISFVHVCRIIIIVFHCCIWFVTVSHFWTKIYHNRRKTSLEFGQFWAISGLHWGVLRMSWRLLLWSVPILINGFGRKNEKFGWVCKKHFKRKYNEMRRYGSGDLKGSGVVTISNMIWCPPGCLSLGQLSLALCGVPFQEPLLIVYSIEEWG